MHAQYTPNCTRDHVRFMAVNGHILSVGRNDLKVFNVYKPVTVEDHRAVQDALLSLPDEPPCPACQAEQKSLQSAARRLQ